ncbi:MAG TPA: hypothetical protein DCQ28_07905 [Bacteroidetes bacterium]|nr:hypothetical protein [Bacteroidota bacterium]
MNENELHERLIDYVEGNISTEQKIEIESFLTKSPLMQNELESIQLALNELRDASDENVPTQYFTNFLPRLRDRLDSGKIHLPMFIPEWFRLVVPTSVVAMIVFSIGIMYQSFKPAELQSSIYSMVVEMEGSEIDSIVDETTNYESNSGVIRGVENFVGEISNADAVDSKLAEDFFVLDVSSYKSEHELLLDLGDKEIEQVLDRLDKPTVQ